MDKEILFFICWSIVKDYTMFADFFVLFFRLIYTQGKPLFALLSFFINKLDAEYIFFDRTYSMQSQPNNPGPSQSLGYGCGPLSC